MQLSLGLFLLLAVETVQAYAFGTPSRPVASPHYQKASITSMSRSKTILFGLLDEIESDSYNLLSSHEEMDVKMNDAYEIFLGELVFSTNDPRVDIMNNLNLATDPEFLDWLEKKIDYSRDPDERLALKDLFEMIDEVKTKIEVSKLAEQRASKEAKEADAMRQQEMKEQAKAGLGMTKTDVLKKAAAIDAASSGVVDAGEKKKEKKSFYEQEITPEVRLSYEKLLKQVLPPHKAGDTPQSIVFSYYDQFDAQFVKVLTERSNNGDIDAKALLEALAVEQQKKIGTAAETLKGVLALGDPMRMEGAVVRLAREGMIDEPFLLLLEANVQQAKNAGANGPAQLMGMFSLVSLGWSFKVFCFVLFVLFCLFRSFVLEAL